MGRTIVRQRNARLISRQYLVVEEREFDTAANAPWVFDLYFVASGVVSDDDSESVPCLRNARIKMQ